LFSPAASFIINPCNDVNAFFICSTDAFLSAGSSCGYEFTEAVCPGGGLSNAVVGGVYPCGEPGYRTLGSGLALGTFSEGLAPAGSKALKGSILRNFRASTHSIIPIIDISAKKRIPFIILMYDQI